MRLITYLVLIAIFWFGAVTFVFWFSEPVLAWLTGPPTLLLTYGFGHCVYYLERRKDARYRDGFFSVPLHMNEKWSGK